MSKAAELAALIGSQTALSNRNKIINGNFQVWQRGTSSGSVGYRTADRWYLNLSGATATASQGTFTDGQTAVPGNPQFYMALNVTTGNDNCGWQYRMEGTHEFANDVYTLSFWAKSATPREMTVKSQSHDLSTDVTQDNTVSPTTFTPTSSWQKFTFKVTHSSMNTLGSFASGDYTRLNITQGSDTSTAAWKLDLAQVQFEKGEQATPFEHRSFADELTLCKRYYQQSRTYGFVNGDSDRGGEVSFRGYTSTAVSMLQWYPFPVEMRAAPSLSTEGTSVPNDLSSALIGAAGFRAGYPNDNTHYAWYYYASSEL
jgi:hypothetical protein